MKHTGINLKQWKYLIDNRIYGPLSPKGGIIHADLAPLLRLRVAASAEQGRGDGGQKRREDIKN